MKINTKTKNVVLALSMLLLLSLGVITGCKKEEAKPAPTMQEATDAVTEKSKELPAAKAPETSKPKDHPAH